MPNFTFTLITDYVTDQADFLDEIFAAGCDDALVAFDAARDVTELEFDREGDDLGETIMATIRQVELRTSVRVLRVGPDEYVWAAEIASRLGVTREYARLLISGDRGPGGFPKPVVPAARNPMWRWADVELWYASWKGDVDVDARRAAVIAFINGTLAMRNAGADLGVPMKAAPQVAQGLDTGPLGGRFDGSTGVEVTSAPTDAEVEAAR